MAISTKPIAPGDISVATAANRVGTGTRAPGTPRVGGMDGAFEVAPRHEWRPGEDHGSGAEGFHHQDRGEAGRDFGPLRFAGSFAAKEPILLDESGFMPVLFADTLRATGVYENNMKLLAGDAWLPMNRRGSRINQLF